MRTSKQDSYNRLKQQGYFSENTGDLAKLAPLFKSGEVTDPDVFYRYGDDGPVPAGFSSGKGGTFNAPAPSLVAPKNVKPKALPPLLPPNPVDVATQTPAYAAPKGPPAFTPLPSLMPSGAVPTYDPAQANAPVTPPPAPRPPRNQYNTLQDVLADPAGAYASIGAENRVRGPVVPVAGMEMGIPPAYTFDDPAQQAQYDATMGTVGQQAANEVPGTVGMMGGMALSNMIPLPGPLNNPVVRGGLNLAGGWLGHAAGDLLGRGIGEMGVGPEGEAAYQANLAANAAKYPVAAAVGRQLPSLAVFRPSTNLKQVGGGALLGTGIDLARQGVSNAWNYATGQPMHPYDPWSTLESAGTMGLMGGGETPFGEMLGAPGRAVGEASGAAARSVLASPAVQRGIGNLPDTGVLGATRNALLGQYMTPEVAAAAQVLHPNLRLNPASAVRQVRGIPSPLLGGREVLPTDTTPNLTTPEAVRDYLISRTGGVNPDTSTVKNPVAANPSTAETLLRTLQGRAARGNPTAFSGEGIPGAETPTEATGTPPAPSRSLLPDIPPPATPDKPGLSPEGPYTRLGIRNRAQLADALTDPQGFGYDPETAHGVSTLWEAVGRSWAERTGQPLTAFYRKYSAAITNGGEQIAQQLADRYGRDPEALRAATQQIPGLRETLSDPEATRHVILALNAPDKSSALHELGHVFLEVLGDTATPEDARALSEWAGVGDGESWTDAHNEKFARAWERWLRTGNAPNASLGGVFGKFREWLRGVYNTVVRPVTGERVPSRKDRLGPGQFTPEVVDMLKRYVGDVSDITGEGKPERAARKNPLTSEVLGTSSQVVAGRDSNAQPPRNGIEPGTEAALPQGVLPTELPTTGESIPRTETANGVTATATGSGRAIPVGLPYPEFAAARAAEEARAQGSGRGVEPSFNSAEGGQVKPSQRERVPSPYAMDTEERIGQTIRDRATGRVGVIEAEAGTAEDGSPMYRYRYTYETGKRRGQENTGYVREADAGTKWEVIRPSEEPEPAKPKAPARPTVPPARNSIPLERRGAETTVYTPGNDPIKTRYAVLDAGELIPSNLDSLAPNPAYDQALQPRDRTTAATFEQVDRIARELNPERLTASSTTAEGAPIVGADRQVESGNGRALAVRRAYQDKPKQAQAYREYLRENAHTFGLTPEQVNAVDSPVLVRVREDEPGKPLAPQERANLAAKMGASPVASMNATETARLDARRLLDSGVIDTFIPNTTGDVRTSQNRDFVRAFAGTLDPTERQAMTTGEGALSSDGATRVERALLAAAYDDPGLVKRLTEEQDEGAKNIASALQVTAGRMAQLRRQVAAGNLRPVDISEDVANAANTFLTITRGMRKGEQTREAVRGYIAQVGMFGDELSPAAQEILAYIGDNNRSSKRIADYLNAYVNAAYMAGSEKQAAMFDGRATTVADLLAAARKFADEQAKTNETINLFDAPEPIKPTASVAPESTTAPTGPGKESAHQPESQSVAEPRLSDAERGSGVQPASGKPAARVRAEASADAAQPVKAEPEKRPADLQDAGGTSKEGANRVNRDLPGVNAGVNQRAENLLTRAHTYRDRAAMVAAVERDHAQEPGEAQAILAHAQDLYDQRKAGGKPNGGDGRLGLPEVRNRVNEELHAAIQEKNYRETLPGALDAAADRIERVGGDPAKLRQLAEVMRLSPEERTARFGKDPLRDYARTDFSGAVGDALSAAKLRKGAKSVRVWEDIPAFEGKPQGTPVPPEATKPVRFEAGKNLTDEQKKEVLRSLGDSYKDLGAPKVHKGTNAYGDEILGYEYNPEYMHRSDITGRPVRNYVTLPDGSRAHPTEVYPNLTKSEIDAEVSRQEAAESLTAHRNQSRRERIAEPAEGASIKTDANLKYAAKNRPREGSFLAQDEKGRVVRVDGSDPEDWPYYQRAGFKQITEPVGGKASEPTPGSSEQPAPTAERPPIADVATEVLTRHNLKDTPGRRRVLEDAIAKGRQRYTAAAETWQNYTLDTYDPEKGFAVISSPRGDETSTRATPSGDDKARAQYRVNLKTGLSNDPDSLTHLNGREGETVNVRGRETPIKKDGINPQLKAFGVPERVISKHTEIARRLIERDHGDRVELPGDILFQDREPPEAMRARIQAERDADLAAAKEQKRAEARAAKDAQEKELEGRIAVSRTMNRTNMRLQAQKAFDLSHGVPNQQIPVTAEVHTPYLGAFGVRPRPTDEPMVLYTKQDYAEYAGRSLRGRANPKIWSGRVYLENPLILNAAIDPKSPQYNNILNAFDHYIGQYREAARTTDDGNYRIRADYFADLLQGEKNQLERKAAQGATYDNFTLYGQLTDRQLHPIFERAGFDALVEKHTPGGYSQGVTITPLQDTTKTPASYSRVPWIDLHDETGRSVFESNPLFQDRAENTPTGKERATPPEADAPDPFADIPDAADHYQDQARRKDFGQRQPTAAQSKPATPPPPGSDAAARDAAATAQARARLLAFKPEDLFDKDGKPLPPKTPEERARLRDFRRTAAEIGRKGLDAAGWLGNEAKTLRYGTDLSAPLSRGWKLLTGGYPLQWAKSLIPAFRSLKRVGYEKVLDEIHTAPDAAFNREMGLDLTTGYDYYQKQNRVDPRDSQRYDLASEQAKQKAAPASDAPKLTDREENFQGQLAQKIPWIRGSDWHYAAFCDSLRVNVYRQMVKQLKDLGYKPEDNAKVFKDAARLVNISTGRGELGKEGSWQAQFMDENKGWINGLFTSPRLAASHVQSLAAMANPSIDPQVRKMAATLYVKHALTTAAIIGAASLFLGAKTSLNPLDSDFGKTRWGNDVIDWGSGEFQSMRWILQSSHSLLSGEPEKAGEATARYAKNRVAPLPSLLGEAASTGYRSLTARPGDGGLNPQQMRAKLLQDTLLLPAPLAPLDIAQGAMREGLPGALKPLPGVFGLNYQNYPPPRPPRPKRWKRVMP